MDPSTLLANMAPVISYTEASELVLFKRVRQAKDKDVDFIPLKKDILAMLYGQAPTDRRPSRESSSRPALYYRRKHDGRIHDHSRSR